MTTAVRIVVPLMLCSLGLNGPCVSAQSKPTTSARDLPAVGQDHDGQHDFDFEFGDWNAQLSRLQNPLSRSTRWIEYKGTSIVRKVWDGRANLGELQLEGQPGRLQGLSLRLYNPQSRQWKISWANAADGLIGPPMSGGFKDGRGVFYGRESFNDRDIVVRFVFSDITATSFRFEQAFSTDEGQTWEVNWKAVFTRSE